MLAQMRVHQSTGEIDVLEVQMLDQSGRPAGEVPYDQDVTFVFKCRANSHLTKPTFGIGVHTTDFVYLASSATIDSTFVPELSPGEHEIRCRIRIGKADSRRLSVSYS